MKYGCEMRPLGCWQFCALFFWQSLAMFKPRTFTVTLALLTTNARFVRSPMPESRRLQRFVLGRSRFDRATSL